jgi:sensor histidine kinase YesM
LYFKDLFERITSIGTEHADSLNEQRVVRVINASAALGITAAIFFIVLDSVLPPVKWERILVLFVDLIVFTLCIYFNSRGYSGLAKWWMLLNVIVVSFLFANVSFRGFYGEYFYLFIPLVTIFLYNSFRLWTLSVLVAILLFYVPNIYLKVYPDQYYGYANAAIIFIANSSIIFYYKNIGLKLEQELSRQKELRVMLMKQRLLQSQLSPHFIYNTLDSVQNLLLESEAELASEKLGMFTKLIRQNMESSLNESVSIADEVNLLRNYVEVYTAQTKLNVALKVNIAENVPPDAHLPSLMLQPFVENALVHAFRQKPEGTIEVTFTEQQQHLLVLIQDNGQWEEQPTQKKHVSRSVQIIEERLSIHNAQHSTSLYLITRPEEKGTTVELLLPLYED